MEVSFDLRGLNEFTADNVIDDWIKTVLDKLIDFFTNKRSAGTCPRFHQTHWRQ